MNSTKILFLKMLKGDIARSTCEKMGTDPNQMTDKEGLLAGQTIKRSGIESFSSYKLMNSDEREIVNLILSELKPKEVQVDSEGGRALLKQIENLVPSSYLPDAVDYKDVA